MRIVDISELAAACRRQDLGFGGMTALELRGELAAGQRFMDGLPLATRAGSRGDAETLVQHPASMTHALTQRDSLVGSSSAMLVRSPARGMLFRPPPRRHPGIQRGSL
jgi:cystathionine beta-lyase/cystathionine gamma-synthase